GRGGPGPGGTGGARETAVAARAGAVPGGPVVAARADARVRRLRDAAGEPTAEVHEDVGGRRPNLPDSSRDGRVNLFAPPRMWTTRRADTPRRPGTASNRAWRTVCRGPVPRPGGSCGTGAPGGRAGAPVPGSRPAGHLLVLHREAGEHARGGQRRGGRLVALVLRRAGQSRPVQRLLLVAAGEQAEADRGAVVEGDASQPVGRRRAHVVEVRGAAADHYVEGDHGVVRAGEGVRDHRQLEGAGGAHHGGLGDAGLAARAQRPGEQAVHDLLVPGGGDDREAGAGRGGEGGGGASVAGHEGSPAVRGVVRVVGRSTRWWPSRSRLVVR